MSWYPDDSSAKKKSETSFENGRLQIPRPDPSKDPAAFAAWEVIQDHLKRFNHKGDNSLDGGPAAPPRADSLGCFNCDRKGHMARDCPEPKKPPQCADFRRGECRRGSSCVYVHPGQLTQVQLKEKKREAPAAAKKPRPQIDWDRDKRLAIKKQEAPPLMLKNVGEKIKRSRESSRSRSPKKKRRSRSTSRRRRHPKEEEKFDYAALERDYENRLDKEAARRSYDDERRPRPPAPSRYAPFDRENNTHLRRPRGQSAPRRDDDHYYSHREPMPYHEGNHPRRGY